MSRVGGAICQQRPTGQFGLSVASAAARSSSEAAPCLVIGRRPFSARWPAMLRVNINARTARNYGAAPLNPPLGLSYR